MKSARKNPMLISQSCLLLQRKGKRVNAQAREILGRNYAQARQSAQKISPDVT